MSTLTIQNLSPEQQSKILLDLEFIKLITEVGKNNNCRIIIHGGYAVDGSLKQITRYHNDIDIQVYAQDHDGYTFVSNLLRKVSDKKTEFKNFQIEDKKQTDFDRNFYVRFDWGIADMYYLQTQDSPFNATKVIVKRDGTFTEPHSFETHTVSIEGTSFEAQLPEVEAAEKIYKREYRGDEKKDKHLQDISNLKLVTSTDQVEEKLNKIIKN